MPDNLRV